MKPIRLLVLLGALSQASCLEGVSFSLTPAGQVSLQFVVPPKGKILSDKEGGK